jgi:hypothetical protein
VRDLRQPERATRRSKRIVPTTLDQSAVQASGVTELHQEITAVKATAADCDGESKGKDTQEDGGQTALW